jgi:hypothetical protein
MKIYYGNNNQRIDITQICLDKLTFSNIITIPSGDSNRASYFTDPLPGVLKKIYIIHNNNETIYDHIYMIKINMLTNTINTTNANDIINKLSIIHAKLVTCPL